MEINLQNLFMDSQSKISDYKNIYCIGFYQIKIVCVIDVFNISGYVSQCRYLTPQCIDYVHLKLDIAGNTVKSLVLGSKRHHAGRNK